MFRKVFGEINRSDKIYLIGSCIVRGVHVKSFEESLGGCIWKRLNQIKASFSVSDRNSLPICKYSDTSFLLPHFGMYMEKTEPNGVKLFCNLH